MLSAVLRNILGWKQLLQHSTPDLEELISPSTPRIKELGLDGAPKNQSRFFTELSITFFLKVKIEIVLTFHGDFPASLFPSLCAFEGYRNFARAKAYIDFSDFANE